MYMYLSITLKKLSVQIQNSCGFGEHCNNSRAAPRISVLEQKHIDMMIEIVFSVWYNIDTCRVRELYIERMKKNEKNLIALVNSDDAVDNDSKRHRQRQRG